MTCLESSHLSVTHLQKQFIIHQNKPTCFSYQSGIVNKCRMSVTQSVSIGRHWPILLLVSVIATFSKSQNFYNFSNNLISPHFTSGLKWPAVHQKPHLVKLLWVVLILSMPREKDLVLWNILTRAAKKNIQQYIFFSFMAMTTFIQLSYISEGSSIAQPECQSK